jgi:SAM-dependent methyltransferase
MPDWDELFAKGEGVKRCSERPVQDFVALIERTHVERPLRIWDLCCGAGRHTEAIAARGHDAFASDLSPTGVALTRERLARQGLKATLAVADMTVCPWAGAEFHGALSWSALHHNRLAKIRLAVDGVLRHLVPGGWFLATLKSTHADSFGVGEQIEPGTFVQSGGLESGVPHHYFDESGIRLLFREWDLSVLLERRCDYRERGAGFLEVNPFDYTAWEVLARKPE